MKTMITLLLTSLFISSAAMAQPTVRNNEYYAVGQVIQMVNADTTGLTAGGAGADTSWNFLYLGSDGTLTTTVSRDTATAFSTVANITETLPGGLIKYIQETSSNSYLWGTYDPSSGITYNYSTYEESSRPFTYGTRVAGSYTVSSTGTSTTYSGTGTMIQTGDAYGTITLPTGTFENVLRIKKVQNEVDTVNSGPTPYTVGINVISYLWFDTVHSAPLLEIDSSSTATGLTRTISYLSSADLEGVPVIRNEPLSYTAWFEDNTLHLEDNFSANKTYEVDVFDMIGTKIYTNRFAGYGENQQFEMNRQVSPGIYIVSVTETDDPSSREVEKVVKH